MRSATCRKTSRSDTGATVASLLGIAAARDAIRAIEAGSVDPAAFDAVGDDWDIEDRARERLARLGLSHVGLDDPVGRLSGGEAVLTALSALFLRRPAGAAARRADQQPGPGRAAPALRGGRVVAGRLLVVSHDRELLSLVDQVADLSGGGLRMYGGNLEAYEAMLATEQAAARRAVSAAEADVRREKRDLMANADQAGEAGPEGRALAASGSIPRIVAGGRKRAAQVTAGKVAGDRASRASPPRRTRLAEAEEAVRDDDTIRISLPGTAVPAGRTVLTVRGLDGAWLPWPACGRGRRVRREEAALGRACELSCAGRSGSRSSGPNGAGKTTLLAPYHRGAGRACPAGLTVAADRRGRLPAAAARRAGRRRRPWWRTCGRSRPAASVNEVRAGLARFLFRGTRADQPAGTLSGGERFRAVLAALLLARPPPQLLLLDEPTNNLDMASARQLSRGAVLLPGALLVVSHDVPFLRSIGITRWLRLERDGRLADAGLLALARPGAAGLTLGRWLWQQAGDRGRR